MTIIVMDPKEGVMLTDRYVVNANKDKRITDCRFDIEQKSKTTEDNHFHYCFDRVVREEVGDLIFNYLIRLENGTLGKDELLKFDEASIKEDIKCYLMTKRGCYVVLKKENSKDVEVIKRNYLSHNFKYGLGPVLSKLNFTAVDLFEVITESNVCCTSDYDVLKAKSLTIIPKAKSKKGTK